MRVFPRVFITATVLAGLLGSAACSGTSSSTSSGGDDSGGTSTTPSGGICDENGVAQTSLSSTDPVYLSLSGLDSNSSYNISVTDPNGESLSPEGGFIATTDEDGNIPTSTLLQDLSTTSDGSDLVLWSSKPTPRRAATAGEHTIQVTDDNGTVILEDTFTVVDGDKVFCADSAGTGRASFTSSETVYARIEKGEDGSLADGTYTCYVSSDLNADLDNGDTLTGDTVSITVTSGAGQAALDSFASGQYDVVCDIDGDGVYDDDGDLLARPGRFRPCFTVQEVNSGEHIVGQVCSDRNGNYRDIFDPDATDTDIRDVWAWISPPERSLVEHAIGVRKYVVSHQDSWTDGDALSDVTGPDGDASFEVDSVQGFCTNEAPWLIWPRERLAEGCYDCVIDVDADGVYDQGTDFVDNIDLNGDNTTCGMRVADSSCADDFISVTSHEDGETVTSTAITLAGEFSETPSASSVTITSGSQSNVVSLGASSTFSAAIPLFNGENLITITALRDSGVACSETFTITSTSENSSNESFRAQLTWDGDTDMDLHLVRPTGAYSNGGGGSDDCNYGNCKVGLEGTESNSIDWGESGEDDDPKLDVDCISCGNGIENIWINDIPEDGDYEVYVDAYSGSETVVNVSISIRGASVGTVSCGAMESGSSTDSCFVGIIRWTGGASGSGSFFPDGSKASTF